MCWADGRSDLVDVKAVEPARRLEIVVEPEQGIIKALLSDPAIQNLCIHGRLRQYLRCATAAECRQGRQRVDPTIMISDFLVSLHI